MIKKKLEIKTTLPDSVFHKRSTATTLFLLYMIGYKPMTMPNNFVNAYLKDDNVDNPYNCPLCLLFRNDIAISHRDKSWSNFEANMRNLPSFRHWYYVGREADMDLVMYVFETTDLLEKDYYKFLEGKYSEFSEEFQSIFCKQLLIDNQTIDVLHYQVIQKNEKLKKIVEQIIDYPLDSKAELWPKPDVYGRETFKRDYVLKKEFFDEEVYA